MNTSWIPFAVALSLLAAVLWSSVRGRRGGLLVLLQWTMAAMLYLSLFPPLRVSSPQRLTILNHDWQGAKTPIAGPTVALPEAEAHENAERVPDLATALRRHPQATQLHLVGRGLSARDLDAVGTRSLTFSPSPARAGIVSLQLPHTVVRGGDFTVHGRAQASAGARVELRDPADTVMAQAEVDADGDFLLHAPVRVAGTLTVELRLLDRDGQLREQLQLPLQVIDAKPLRLWVLAGAANPELKYLRRWARDAGLTLHTRISAGAGVVLGDPAQTLDASTLRDVDALLLDARQLDALGDAQFERIDRAVRAGLGALVRLDGPLSARSRKRLSDWGFDWGADGGTALVQLEAGNSSEPMPVLHRRAVMPRAEDWVPLWRDAHGTALGAWRARGRGRVAVVTVTDSFQLVLSGHADRHTMLWSQAIAVIGRGIEKDGADASPTDENPAEERRAEDNPAVDLAWPMWQGERTQLCGLREGASLRAPDGQGQVLPVDPATAARRCAAFWPEHAGWYALEQGQTRIRFLVWPADAAAAWRQKRAFDATHARVRDGFDATPANTPYERGPAWPWSVAWLLLAGLIWRMEKARDRATATR